MKTVTSLLDIVDNHEFIENPLDAYETYTYNIEWFVVDKNADREFQAMEAYNVETIINDGWPGHNINKVIIAKTGVTTEFVLTDLNIESVGTGNATYSKIAGTAVFLDFNITQVGETNLVDNLQNSIAICGYDTLQMATFYIKINFVGFDNNGKKVKMPQTKVFPFWIKDFAGVQTQTDAKGTTTALSGTIIHDKVVMDDILSKTEDHFRYDIKDTLFETLQEFIEKLNQSNENAHLNLQPNLQNTYKVTLSDRFMEWAGGTSIKDEKINSTKDMEPSPHRSNQVGQVMPRTNIYGVLEEICLNAVAVKKEQTELKPDYTKVLKITPWLIPKKDGYNPIQGRNAYDIEYYVDYELKPVIHNLIDQWSKARRAKYMIQKLFNDERVNKKYNYLFTGKNDQILDFNITLENELTKIYTTPSDYWALEHFLKRGTYENDKLWGGYIKRIEDAQAEQKEADGIYQDLKAELESLVEKDKAEGVLIRNQLIDAVATTRGMPPGMIAQQFKSMSTAQVLNYVNLDPDMKDYHEDDKFKDKLTSNQEIYKKALAKVKKQNALNIEAKEEVNTLLSDAYANHLSRNGIERYKSHQEFFDKLAKKSTRGMILTEELDNDVISKLSNEEYQTILKSQQNNPIEFRRVIHHTLEKQRNDTIKSTKPELVEQAKLKYYESKTNNISMIEAQMTIKGDPYWLEGFLSPSLAKKTFGDLGTIKDNKGLNLNTTINGTSGLVLVSGVSAGTDLHDNVLKRNMITSVYMITSINSSFAGGTFTQALTMIKNTEAEVFGVDEGPRTVGPPLPELSDKNDNTGNVDNSVIGIIPFLDEFEIGEEYWDDGDDYIPPKNVHHNLNKLLEGQKTGLLGDLGDFNAAMFYAMLPWENRTGQDLEPIDNAPPNWIHHNTEQYVEAQIITTDNTIIVQTEIVDPPLDSNASVRNVLANQTLEQLGGSVGLSRICESEQKRGQIPFDACDTIKDGNKKMLESFGLTIEDQGKASTITAMNTQINDWIAQGITFNDEEIAVYQIAAGGQLTIVGHDQDVVEKLVRKATFERTPVIILEEQADGKTTEIVSGPHQNHAIANNRILDGSKPLNQFTVQGTAINTRKLQNYHNSDGSIKTDADIEAEYKAIQADTNCVGACRTKKTILLGKVDVDAAIARKVLGELQKKKVESIVKKSCPDGHANSFFTDSREFECVPILPNTLTDDEMGDVEILKEKVNEVFHHGIYSTTGIETEKTWKTNMVAEIEKEINDNDLIISEEDKNALKLAAAVSINSKVALSELSDDEYSEIKEYETAIDTVIADANDGHRGDLTTAAVVAATEDELVKLNADLNETNVELTKFFWDTKGNQIWAAKKEDIEVEMAELMLGQPDETMTAVVTEISGFDHTYTPIFNPTDTLNDSPVIMKNLDTGEFDVVLAGVDSTYGGVNEDYLDQLTEAKRVFYELTRMDRSGDIVTYTDDMGIEYNVKDFSNIGPITLSDGTIISTPSTTFGIYTLDENDIKPANKKDYVAIRQQIADYFPNIEIISSINGFAPTLSTLKDNTGQVILNGTAFIINPSP